jgi:hypothetical protein
MHQAQLLAYGLEGRLAEILQEVADARALWLRPVRHPKTCLNLLRQGGPGVLVLRLGRDLDQELTLLEQVTHFFPATRVLVIGPAPHPALAALAWDLGASYVLFPPDALERVRDAVLGIYKNSCSGA